MLLSFTVVLTLFNWCSAAWTAVDLSIPSLGETGSCVGMSQSGNQIVVGSPAGGTGSTGHYDITGNTLVALRDPSTTAAGSGVTCTISGDGNYVITSTADYSVLAYLKGTSAVRSLPGGSSGLTSPPWMNSDGSIVSYVTRQTRGSSTTNRLYLYTRDGTVWYERGVTIFSNDNETYAEEIAGAIDSRVEDNLRLFITRRPLNNILFLAHTVTLDPVSFSLTNSSDVDLSYTIPPNKKVFDNWVSNFTFAVSDDASCWAMAKIHKQIFSTPLSGYIAVYSNTKPVDEAGETVGNLIYMPNLENQEPHSIRLIGCNGLVVWWGDTVSKMELQNDIWVITSSVDVGSNVTSFSTNADGTKFIVGMPEENQARIYVFDTTTSSPSIPPNANTPTPRPTTKVTKVAPIIGGVGAVLICALGGVVFYFYYWKPNHKF